MSLELTIGTATFTGDMDKVDWEVGGKAANGERSVGSIYIFDDDGTFKSVDDYTLKQWSLTEDASGTAVYLGRGRIMQSETFRDETKGVSSGEHIAWKLTTECMNAELVGITLTSDWARNEETDVARVLALGTAFLDGNYRATTDLDTTTYVPNTNTVTMEAKTYPAGTTVLDILSECAGAAAKLFFVTIDHELYYSTPQDDIYDSTITVTDVLAAINNTTHFAPEWNLGPALTWNGQNIASGFVASWADGRSVLVEDATLESDYDTWIQPLNVDDANSEAQAERMAQGILNIRGLGERTYAFTLHLQDDQVHLVKPGQRLPLRSSAARAKAQLNKRIAEIKWKTNGNGWYEAQIFLEKPHRIYPVGSGGRAKPKPAQPPTITVGTGTYGSAGTGGQTTGSPLTLICPSTVNAGDLLVAHITRESHGTMGTPAGWTKHATADQTPDLRSFLFWKVADGTEDSDAIEFPCSNLGVAKYGQIYRFTGGVTGASLGVVTTTDGSSVSSADAPAVSGTVGALGLLFVGVGQSQSLPDMTGESGVNWAEVHQDAGGIGGYQLQTGTLTAATTSGGSMALAAGTDYLIMGLTLGEGVASGGNAPPDMVGDDPEYARNDHIHVQFSHRDPTANDDADDLYKAGDWWVRVDDVDNPTTIEGLWLLLDETAGAAVWDQIPAAAISVADEGGYFDATNIEDVLQEIGAGVAGGVTDHGDLTGLDDDDHPQYLRASDGEKHVINVVAASGATETLDLIDGNIHDVTLTDGCTLTLAGATAGVACRMAILLRQDGTGSRTVTWPAAVEWVGGSAPTLETAANAWNWVSLVTLDGGTTWFGDGGGASSSVTASEVSAFGFVGPILISDNPSTPLVFADLLQNEDQDDLIYADI